MESTRNYYVKMKTTETEMFRRTKSTDEKKRRKIIAANMFMFMPKNKALCCLFEF